MAEWLRRGLQILARRFDSGSGLQLPPHVCPDRPGPVEGQALSCGEGLADTLKSPLGSVGLSERGVLLAPGGDLVGQMRGRSFA